MITAFRNADLRVSLILIAVNVFACMFCLREAYFIALLLTACLWLCLRGKAVKALKFAFLYAALTGLSALMLGVRGLETLWIFVNLLRRLLIPIVKQSICVFISAPLPWCMGIRKVELQTVQRLCNQAVLGKFFAPIWCDCSAFFLGQGRKQRDHLVCNQSRISLCNFSSQQIATAPGSDGYKAGRTCFPRYGIRFPMSNDLSAVSFFGSLLNPVADNNLSSGFYISFAMTQANSHIVYIMLTKFEEAADNKNQSAMALYDEKSHEAIIQVSHNAFLLGINDVMAEVLRSFRGRTFSIHTSAEFAVDAHRKIVEAIMQQNQMMPLII